MKPFAVELPQYAGPVELLLQIVRREELDIASLPLAPLAAQYLAYIREAEELDVNLGMEWIDMAARLIQWKAASLLPADPELPDPGAALARELGRELRTLSEAQLDQAREFLTGRNEERDRFWTNSPGENFREVLPDEAEEGASLWTLRRKAQYLRDLFRARQERRAAIYEMDLDSTTVEEMRTSAMVELEAVERGVWFSAAAWFLQAGTQARRIYLFLALLDLAAGGALRIEEDTVAGGVRLCRR